ncbi:MAG TPA: neutral zinc metallopeptidase [Candidatus Saccharimonadales bacterium]
MMKRSFVLMLALPFLVGSACVGGEEPTTLTLPPLPTTTLVDIPGFDEDSGDEEDDGSPFTGVAYEPSMEPAPCLVPETAGSYEGCFVRVTTWQAIHEMHLDVTLFYATVYQQTLAETIDWSGGYVTVHPGETLQTECGPQDDWTLLYCHNDQKVYIGVSAAWDILSSEAGDYGLVLAIAHERGHAFQGNSAIGIVDLTNQRVEELYAAGTDADLRVLADILVATENQADCMAGAAANFFANNGFEEADDVIQAVQVAGLWGLLSEAEKQQIGVATHGSVDERVGHWTRGYRDGLEACENAFVKLVADGQLPAEVNIDLRDSQTVRLNQLVPISDAEWEAAYTAYPFDPYAGRD